MLGPSREIVEELKLFYTPGTRVVLKKMDDMQAPPVGTQGTVTGVDDIGSIHVNWDNGSCLAALYDEDVIAVIEFGK